MNRERRKALTELVDTLRNALSDLETYRDEEQEYYDSNRRCAVSLDPGIYRKPMGSSADPRSADPLDLLLHSVVAILGDDGATPIEVRLTVENGRLVVQEVQGRALRVWPNTANQLEIDARSWF